MFFRRVRDRLSERNIINFGCKIICLLGAPVTYYGAGIPLVEYNRTHGVDFRLEKLELLLLCVVSVALPVYCATRCCTSSHAAANQEEEKADNSDLEMAADRNHPTMSV